MSNTGDNRPMKEPGQRNAHIGDKPNSTGNHPPISGFCAPPIWRDMTAEAKLEIALAKIAGKPIYGCNPSDEKWAKVSFVRPFDDMSYRVRPPEPKVETVTLYGRVDGPVGFGDYATPEDTHTITLTIRDGEPDCASIKMEEL